MGAPVVHFEIGAANGDRSRRFYADLFGWTVTPFPGGEDYGVVDTGSGTGIGGGIMQAPEGMQPWVTVYVGVDDLEKSLSRAEELGARRVMGPAPVGDMGEIAMFADPDGNILGLFAATREATPAEQ
ncbi:VOC family protein [Pseudonocardia yuanmonensis]|uniref:VOC family protein n=1 Tax=Pseudonocardia yuanmonensis TaxID=1095914 RepID=A0ABP8W036_9PSEU